MHSLKDQKTDRSSQEETYRMGLVRAGMTGAQLQYHQEEIYMFPFVDYISLFFQSLEDGGPLAFLLWHGDTCKFSSFGDIYFTSKYQLGKEHLKRPHKSLLISKKEDVWFSIHKIKNLDFLEGKYPSYEGLKIGTIKQDEVLEPYHEAIEDIKELLFGRSSALGPRLEKVSGFIPLLIKSIKKDRLAYPQIPEARTIPSLNYEAEVLPMLESFRSVLDDVFEDTQLVRRVESGADKPQLGNIYCVIRSVSTSQLRCGWFPYTAGLLLSREQKIILEKWCSDCIGKAISKGKRPCGMMPQHGAECSNILEYPLGPRSRSVADAVFCSGVIDFARAPNDKLWDRADANDERDLKRIKVESCIYPPKSDFSLYYVPIHVGGIPWLALFTFTPTNYKGRWLHNYTFYRDVIPRASSLIREQVRQKYFTQLGKTAVESLLSLRKSLKNVSDEINTKWSVLAQIFPFPLFSIDSDNQMGSKATESIDIPRQGKWYISCVDNPFYGNPQIRWGITDNKEYLIYLISVLQNQLAERQMISFEQRVQVLDELHHDLGTSITKMDSILCRYDLSENTKCDKLEKELVNLKTLYKNWTEPDKNETEENVSIQNILKEIENNNQCVVIKADDSISLTFVKANKTRLYSHLNQLIINGMQASTAIDNQIIITSDVASTGRSINIQIADSGCGLSDSIFEKATQGTIYGEVRDHRGLSNCIKYINKIGGEVTKKTNVNIGTTLIVTLPISVKVQE